MVVPVLGPWSCGLGGRRGEHGDRCRTVTSCSFIIRLQTTAGVGAADSTDVPLDTQRVGWLGLPLRVSALRPSSVQVLQGCCSRDTCGDADASWELGGSRRGNRGQRHAPCEAWAERLGVSPRAPPPGAPTVGTPRALSSCCCFVPGSPGACGFPVCSVVSSQVSPCSEGSFPNGHSGCPGRPSAADGHQCGRRGCWHMSPGKGSSPTAGYAGTDWAELSRGRLCGSRTRGLHPHGTAGTGAAHLHTCCHSCLSLCFFARQ